jgi:hypothetical protein
MGINLARAMIFENSSKRFQEKMRSYKLDLPHKPVIGEVEPWSRCPYEPSHVLQCIPAYRWHGLSIEGKYYFLDFAMSNKFS